MKKIDSIYVVCNKRDLYFTKVCIASIRYWNDYTPVYLIKDLSKGDFDTGQLEEKFGVKIASSHISSMGYFAKLLPLMEPKNERLLMVDCDIVWMCDVVKLLQQYDEDIVVDGYSPEDTEAEKHRWYFFEPSFSKNFPHYIYPGFFFNVGQMLLNATTFSKEEFLQLIDWKEDPSAKIPDTFFHEQGILNYLAAKKIVEKTATHRNVNFHLWGWDERVSKLKVSDIEAKKTIPFLIHWYGIKKGILSFLPGSKILKFYETFYYSRFPDGNSIKIKEQLKRTFRHPVSFGYELLKSVYYKVLRK